MEQFTVPQFIDEENKILGPITVRQFLIMLALSGVCFLEYKLFDFSLFLFSAIITAGIFMTVAFVKINGRPFHFFILNLIQSLFLPRLRLWNKNYGKDNLIIQANTNDLTKTQPPAVKTRFSSSRLAELSLIVDTRGAYYGEMIDDSLEDLPTID